MTGAETAEGALARALHGDDPTSGGPNPECGCEQQAAAILATLTDLGYSVVPKGEVERLREALQVAEGTLNRMTVVDQRASVGIFIAAINQTLDEVSSALRGEPDATD